MSFPLIHPKLSLKWLASHAAGKGIDVAVIDSGVDASHPELAGRVRRGCIVSKNRAGQIRTRTIQGDQCRDRYGHGTAVAGIIADLAPKIRIIDVRVLDEFNACSGDVLIAGLKWALDRKIRLINMSLATSKPVWIPALRDLCERAYVQNSIIVAARRNFGDLGCPAMFSSVISVDRQDWVEKLRLRYRPRDPIKFEARGTEIRVLGPGGSHAIQTGTSFATPHVCGMVALLMEIFPRLTAVEAQAALKACAERIKTP